MKIQLNYEPITGNITTNSGIFLVSYIGLEAHEVKDQPNTTVDSAIVESLSTKSKLNTDDILKLREAGII